MINFYDEKNLTADQQIVKNKYDIIELQNAVKNLGFIPKGVYDSGTLYNYRDSVIFSDDKIYIHTGTADTIGIAPTDTAVWTVFANGIVGPVGPQGKVGPSAVKVAGVLQDTVSFDSDPQTQLNEIPKKQNFEILFYKTADASELADIVDLESFYAHFYALRKSPQRRFMFEYSTTDLAFDNVIHALGGFAPQIDTHQKCICIIDLPISEAGGFEINVQSYAKNGYPKVYQDIKGWETNYIVTTGWYGVMKDTQFNLEGTTLTINL